MNDNRDRILAFVVQYIKEHGFPPAVRDIMQGAGISSTSVVSYNLKKLVKEGRISMAPGGITRSIVVLGQCKAHQWVTRVEGPTGALKEFWINSSTPYVGWEQVFCLTCGVAPSE